jgi:hypothetical protein
MSILYSRKKEGTLRQDNLDIQSVHTDRPTSDPIQPLLADLELRPPTTSLEMSNTTMAAVALLAGGVPDVELHGGCVQGQHLREEGASDRRLLNIIFIKPQAVTSIKLLI